jgi:hypothetical protein
MLLLLLPSCMLCLNTNLQIGLRQCCQWLENYRGVPVVQPNMREHLRLMQMIMMHLSLQLVTAVLLTTHLAALALG